MTIALGVLGNDGVVVAADSEYTWSYLKTSGKKVFSDTANGTIGITGSGDSGYLRGLSQELIAIFKAKQKAGVDGLENAFKEQVNAFFATHVIPCAVLQPQPICDVIIGVQRNGQRRLWQTTHTVLQRCESHAATGIGAEYAIGLIARIIDPHTMNAKSITLPVAERIAVYAIQLVKRHVQNCGQETQIVRLTAKDVEDRSSELPSLEYLFALQSQAEALAMQYGTGCYFSNEKFAADELARCFKEIRRRAVQAGVVTTSARGWSLEEKSLKP